MFRHLLILPRNRSTPLVSSTLLMRAWQTKGISILGQKTKIRYIFMQVTQTQIRELLASPLSFAGLRQASTTVNKSDGSHGPPNPTSFLDVKIPYLSQSDPQTSVQIPYVPDFWDSSSPSVEPVSKETLPKLLVVAGAGTHHGGGPSHNLLDISSGSENNSLGSVIGEASSGSRSEEKGLWDDMADDIGLPPTNDVKNAFRKLFS
ncbi:hypothetical protein BYT27DRAFT_7203768 [Phlegmacium glaucopus]|nr:hypothetical protein BYT27DRAFT_7203768 [Phlegmacium glaucopus]